MTRKAEFNAEEWDTVVQGPVFAGLWVISASKGGTIRESLAMSRVYKDAREQQGESELLDELVVSPPALDARQLQQAGGSVPALATERIRHAAEVVDAKATPAEGEAYRKFAVMVARAAAGAHKEGGFLGIGGQEISPAEQEALDGIVSALGSTPEAAPPQ